MIDLYTINLFEDGNQFHNGKRSSRTYVENLVVLFHLPVYHTAHGADVDLGQVGNVYIVPKASSVRGRVVVSEDAEAFALAGSGLGDERNQILRYSARQFSDKG